MKSYIVMLLGLLISVGSVYALNDIQGSPYQGSILYLVDQGVVQGYPDGTFRPQASLTRAELMKIALEATRVKLNNEKNCFSDATDQRYVPYVCYAYTHGMVKGIGNNRFGPDYPVTIAQGLKIIINAFGGFDIVEGQGDQRYVPYVDFAIKHQLIDQVTNPDSQSMTRGQMAYITHQLMFRARGNMPNNGPTTPPQSNNTNTTNPSQTPISIQSLGCGVAAPSTVINKFVVEGVTRNAIVDIPSRYDSNTPHKLVIARHGRTNSNSQVRGYLGLTKTVDSNTIVVYPLALPEGGPSRSWSTTTDVTYFDTIVQELSQAYCIDKSKIYVIGHSLGGWFANTLACMRGDVIAGLGSVGGSVTRKDCAGPVPAMIMHHPDDNLASYAGGIVARDLYLEQNGCDVNSVIPYPGSADKSNCVQYQCAHAPVVRCPHSEDDTWGYYYPHTWPSFATKMIWNFWAKN